MVKVRQDGDTELSPNLLAIFEKMSVQGTRTLILVIVNMIYCILDLIQTEERNLKRGEIGYFLKLINLIESPAHSH
jgi:hypothetical protein